MGRTAVKSTETDGAEMLGVGRAAPTLSRTDVTIPGTIATPVCEGTVALLSLGTEMTGMPTKEVTESMMPLCETVREEAHLG